MTKLEEFASIISYEFNVEEDFYKHRIQNNKYVIPRKVLMYFLYTEERIGYKDIGNMLGGYDHSTVIHHVRHAQEWYKADEWFRRKMDRLFDKINEIYSK